MCLFCSNIDRNQIIAAVLSFVGMMVYLSLYMFQGIFEPGSTWREVFAYASFFDMWRAYIQGNFAPRFLIFHISAAVFFLFLSVKVVEARKWK